MSILSKRVKNELLASCAQISQGRLRLRTPEGEVHEFGQGSPAAEVEIHDWAMVPAIAARGSIGLGETYVAGLWDTPSIRDFAELALRNLDRFAGYATAGGWNGLKFRLVNGVMRANSRRGAARNIRAHYDVGNEFYQLWLDPSMTYSSALFEDGETDLARGQARKYDRILERIAGRDQMLEIGCGWGGFAERAADRGHGVTGLTISPSQKGYADARLDGRADIRLQDYREVRGKFDAIVSIEMIEAVGERFWPVYFATLKARLAEGGKAVLQAITVPDEAFPTYRKSSDYIRHHTFPGGMLLSDAVIRDQAARVGLRVQDSHAFGADYARTCDMWSARMCAQSDKVKRLGYDDAFLRSWQFYLGICAATFATGRTDVMQVELAHV